MKSYEQVCYELVDALRQNEEYAQAHIRLNTRITELTCERNKLRRERDAALNAQRFLQEENCRLAKELTAKAKSRVSGASLLWELATSGVTEIVFSDRYEHHSLWTELMNVAYHPNHTMVSPSSYVFMGVTVRVQDKNG